MLVYLVPFSAVAGYMFGGLFTFLTPVAVFGVIPFIDLMVGKDVVNVPENREKELEETRPYRYITWACAPIQVILVMWGLYTASNGNLQFIEFLGLSVSVGVSSGIMGINVSHELVHRLDNKLEPFLSRLMLWTVLYMHWGLEHVVGHHRNVATAHDPATAKFGQSVYAFLPQTVFGSFLSVRDFEENRLKKAGIPVFSFHNRVVVYTVLQALLILFATLFFGFKGLAFLLIQSFTAIFLLEVVNYIEHYGLLRKMTDDRPESVKPWHSWNSSNRVTNRFLFNLQRHSDHHYKPGRRYQILRHFDESPQLPTGYAGMILLAVIPPLWRRIMDPKIMDIRNREDREARFV
jgi:alkane 1-monooxygenase